MKFYTATSDYIEYLRGIDNKVYYSGRPFVGIVLTIGNHRYIAPLTSYKIKQDLLDSSLPTHFKLHERSDESNKLGMIQIKNMIPFLESEVFLFDVDAQDHKYKIMLYKQYEFIKMHKDEIIRRAENIYKLVTIDNHRFFKKISCDFKLLEEKYTSFKK